MHEEDTIVIYRPHTGGVLLAFPAVVLTACVGCIPYYGLGQRRVPQDPVVFTDAKTGVTIGRCLGHSPLFVGVRDFDRGRGWPGCGHER
jgi:hypothetical protein